MPRVDLRRAAPVGALLAAGTLIVLLGAHVTPDRYHAHTRLHPLPPDAAAPKSGTFTQTAGISLATDHRTSAWISIPLLIIVVIVVLVVCGTVLMVLTNAGRRGRWARGRSGGPGPKPGEQAGDDLARKLAQALDGGLEGLADGSVNDAIIACWVSMRGAALAAGVAPRASDTPAEFISRVLVSSRVQSQPLRELTELYREARFSVHRMAEADRTRARAALEAVRADLLAGVHA